MAFGVERVETTGLTLKSPNLQQLTYFQVLSIPLVASVDL